MWDGPAIGAGAELLLAADVRVIGADATMAFPEVGAGELPCWGGTQRLTRAGGVALALRMLVIGDAVDADALERSGAGGARPTIPSRSRERARRRGSRRRAARAGGRARRGAARAATSRSPTRSRLESDLNLLLSTTADRAEGIAAFFEKRPPRFTGE